MQPAMVPHCEGPNSTSGLRAARQTGTGSEYYSYDAIESWPVKGVSANRFVWYSDNLESNLPQQKPP